jgi:hypothetical protein
MVRDAVFAHYRIISTETLLASIKIFKAEENINTSETITISSY